MPSVDDLRLSSTALPFDPGFALRTCKEVGHLPGTVHLLKLMGMHQQALQTALQAVSLVHITVLNTFE